MALANIIFQVQDGGLNRLPEGQDYISGLLFGEVKPASWGSEAVQVFFSLQDAEQAGITAADYPTAHYHISEFFGVLESFGQGGQLYVGFTGATATEFATIRSLQVACDGRIRQIGVYLPNVPFVATLVTALQNAATGLDNEFFPASILLSCDFTGLQLSSLPDMKTLNCPNVSVVIGQSGKGTGATLAAALGYSVGSVGAVLGAVAYASVEENIGWIGKFNLARTELDELAFATGTPYRSVSRTQLDDLDSKQYVFLRKITGRSGSYCNFDYTSTTGDYSRIALQRTIDKAKRGVRTTLVPFVNAPVEVDAQTGRISANTAKAYETAAQRFLDLMRAAGEISGGRVSVDPAQNVLANDRITVALSLVPIGTSKSILVYIGFKTKL